MNNAQMTARVGLFFLIGMALIWVTFEALHNGGFSRNKGYPIVAAFNDLRELKTGDEVRMAGVKIGTVSATRLHARHAEAVLLIDPEVKVASDAVATVAAAGLLGSDYISVTLGSFGAPPLEPGAEIRTKHTAGMNEIVEQIGDLGEKLKGVVGELGRSLGAGENGLFGKLDKLVTDNGPKLTETIANLRDVTGKINTGSSTLGHLVNDSRLHDELLAGISDIKSAAAEAKTFVGNAQDIIDQVKSGQGALGTLVYDEEAAKNLKTTVQNLRNVSDKLNSGQGTLGKLINDDSLFNEAKTVMRKVDRAADGLSDQGPITAVGIVAKSLF